MAYIDMTWQKVRGEERTAGGGGRGREEVEDELKQSTKLSDHETPWFAYQKKKRKETWKNSSPKKQSFVHIKYLSSAINKHPFIHITQAAIPERHTDMLSDAPYDLQSEATETVNWLTELHTDTIHPV